MQAHEFLKWKLLFYPEVIRLEFCSKLSGKFVKTSSRSSRAEIAESTSWSTSHECISNVPSNYPSTCRLRLSRCKDDKTGKSWGKLFLSLYLDARRRVLWHLKHSIPRRHVQRKQKGKRIKRSSVCSPACRPHMLYLLIFFFVFACWWVDIRLEEWVGRDNLPGFSISSARGWGGDEEKEQEEERKVRRNKSYNEKGKEDSAEVESECINFRLSLAFRLEITGALLDWKEGSVRLFHGRWKILWVKWEACDMCVGGCRAEVSTMRPHWQQAGDRMKSLREAGKKKETAKKSRQSIKSVQEKLKWKISCCIFNRFPNVNYTLYTFNNVVSCLIKDFLVVFPPRTICEGDADDFLRENVAIDGGDFVRWRREARQFIRI